MNKKQLLKVLEQFEDESDILIFNLQYCGGGKEETFSELTVHADDLGQIILCSEELKPYDDFDGQQVLGWQTLDDIKKVMFEISMLPEKQEMEKYNERY